MGACHLHGYLSIKNCAVEKGNMMHKVIILTAADPYLDVRALKMATSLTKKNYHVTVIGGKSSKPAKGKFVFSIESFSEAYDNKQSVYKKVLQKIKFIQWIGKKIKLCDPDIIHACNVDMLAAAFWYKKKKTVVIYDSYEICSSKEGAVSQSAVLRNIVICVEKRLVPKCASIICVSYAAKQWFEDHFPRRPEIQVITNVPIRLSSVDEIPAKRLDKFPVHVTYIGMLGKNRGIEEVIEAGSLLDPQMVRIDIRGFGQMKSELRTLAEQKKATNIVDFLDPVPQNQILLTLEGTADIGLVLTKPTSLNHQLTVSNKIFDYINAGMPVIMSNVEEHKRLNQQFEFGVLVDSVDATHIAEAINALIHNPELYCKLAQNAKKAAEKLNWDNEEQKLYAIYDKTS